MSGQIRFECREDEAQLEKFREILEILLAAGYFRARIKGLRDFDKLVGGMTWCINMCNVDIHIDIMYEEDLTIGQKISLTEKLVWCLKTMKCPFSLEPHQIQGMDCIHIFPVVQWLVQRSMLFAEVKKILFKDYATQVFRISHPCQQLEQIAWPDKGNVERKLRSVMKDTSISERLKVRCTVSEYRGSLDRATGKESTEEFSQEVAPDIADLHTEVTREPVVSNDLLSSIFNEKNANLIHLSRGDHSDIFVDRESLLKKNRKNLENELEKIRAKIEVKQAKIEKLIEKIAFVNEQKPPDAAERLRNPETRHLNTELAELLRQIKTFSRECKEKKKSIEAEIKANAIDESEKAYYERVLSAFNNEQESLKSVKIKLSAIKKPLIVLQRKIDDIPKRSELTQYQKRFIELYNQIASNHNETKKFYVFYNQLQDHRVHLDKERELLISTLNNFVQVNLSRQQNRDQFLMHFQHMCNNIYQAQLKIDKRESSVKSQKDSLTCEHLELIEKRRIYSVSVRELVEEIKKYEILNDPANRSEP